MKKEHMTWADFDEACEVLRNKLEPLKDCGNIKSIYGVPRGGLVLAVKLSHLLNLELVDYIGSKTLIVDDISDSGGTLIEYMTTYGAHYTATLYYHKKTILMPDFTVYEKKDAWIVFPWEV